MVQKVLNKLGLQKALILNFHLSRTKNPKMLTGILVVGGLGLLAVVVVIVAIMRIQKARAEINKAKLEAHMKSMEAYAMGEVIT